MFSRFSVWLVVRLAEVVQRVRRTPDAGMETADKILWAAVVTIVVGVVGAIFRDKLRDFANGLTVTLGW
ncbi:hypothetical protein [Virgisporangium aurantiacum]|uniref:Uncharacterized protein n=1 Tax=Virgisporangium aurantiacum TaxID=175570 RepID=A0A8J3ZDX7_9ACTN|nr:hypothetical protein [Virgisporangium aurantiacum]GIJ62404.1 hypothetical protein Vau01_099200 [Virgisporangium aurantiacum]